MLQNTLTLKKLFSFSFGAMLLILITPTLAYAYVASGYVRPSGSASFYFNSGLVGLGWQSAMNGAHGVWDNAGSSFSFSQAGTSSRSPSLVTSSTNDGYNDVGYAALGGGYVAYTVSTANGSNITETDTAYNTNLAFSTNPGASEFDVQSVGAHELGHWLHLSETQSWRCLQGSSNPTMCSSISPGTTYMRWLEGDDINGINYIY